MFFWLSPFVSVAHAATTITPDILISRIQSMILNPIIALMFAIALLVFIWGVVQFLGNQGGGEEKALVDGKRHMLWGIIGLLVMVSVYGIMRLVINTLGLTGPNGAYTLPQQ